MENKRPTCPICGSNNVSFIIYGFPAYSKELERQLQNKEVVLGGCVISDEASQWECQDCKEQFGEMIKELE